MKKFYYNPFIPFGLVEPELFIDRESDIDTVIRYLCYEGSNVRISGERGIGKSSFLNKLYQIINDNHKNCLVVKLELFSVLSRQTIDLSQYFLSSIISCIWKEIFNKTYSELIEEIKLPDEKILKSNEQGKIITLYKLIRSSNLKSSFERSADLGAEFILKSGVSTKSSSDFEFNGILPYELTNILQELSPILKKYGKDKIILLLDEANYLNLESADKIIRENFNLFSNEYISYAFVTFNSTITMSYEAEKIFHRDIQLKGFESIAIIQQLIETYCKYGNAKENCNVSFSDESIGKIWDYSLGVPRRIQHVCNYAWSEAIEKSISILEEKLINDIILKVKNAEMQHNILNK